MHSKSLKEIADDLKNKRYSAQELTQHYLKRIKQLDKKLNSYITVTEDLALEQAKAADERIASGKTTPLTGIPISHKDIFCTAGIKTSCGSKMLDNFTAPYESTVTAKLKQAGTVLLGKTNMDEFAMGSGNENSHYGPVHNPWHLQHVPGGSSGGSAAAVAARLTPAALGTDTGGSIRQPSAYCGVTGIKPTYGSVSRFGITAFASSLDQAGPFALNAEDLAILLNYMIGFDYRDSTSCHPPGIDYTALLDKPLTGIKIGLPREYFADLNTAVAVKIDEVITTLEKLGATTKELSLPNYKLGIAAYYVIAPAECSSNLARYDGVRYGHRCRDPKNLDELYFKSRSEGFGAEVKRRIMIGTYVLSSGYYDAYYLKAQKIRRLISEDFQNAFKEVDVVFSPTTPTPAFEIGNKEQDPVNIYLNDVYTVAVNLAGLPGLSMPAGFIEGLPVGAQLIGNHFTEAKLLNIAHQYQQVTEWHKLIPEGFE